ncbi:MAG: hypothetical protein QNK37_27750 [Acidobacteriota bacterium]|nr:hypothetical protein [Acidobacteriota bacterium]
MIAGIAREPAEKITALLASTGMEVACQPMEEPFERGDRSHEIALVVNRIANMPQIVQEVMQVLACDSETAGKILCRSPAVLLGNISRATVSAIQKRFEPLGVSVDVSRPSETVFDIFIQPCSPETRRRAIQAIRQTGAETLEDALDAQSTGALLAMGLDQQQALKLWAGVERSGLPLLVLNRDFQRFDIRLLHAPPSEAFSDYLVRTTGMPEKAVPKVLAHVPVVLMQNVPHTVMLSCLKELKNFGAEAIGDLITFQTFLLTLESVSDRDNTVEILKRIGNIPYHSSNKLLSRLPAGLDEPLPALRARWLRHELSLVGTQSSLELRQ